MVGVTEKERKGFGGKEVKEERKREEEERGGEEKGKIAEREPLRQLPTFGPCQVVRTEKRPHASEYRTALDTSFAL